MLPFRFEAKMMAVFRFHFASFLFEAKRMAVFCFRFASFRCEAKMMQFFATFSFCFRFVPFSFRFRFLRFASMRNKRKKHFFASKRKKFCFRFASFRFEAKMTAHPSLVACSQTAFVICQFVQLPTRLHVIVLVRNWNSSDQPTIKPKLNQPHPSTYHRSWF